jgi:hypothetical protein
MSVAVLESCHPDLGDGRPKPPKDHEYPRKLAATGLLTCTEVQAEPAMLLELYVGKVRKYNYVTPQENEALVGYQKRASLTTQQTFTERQV